MKENTFLSSWWRVPFYYTSLCVHRGDGFYQQRRVGLGVLHKHQQELQSCFHHQTELEGSGGGGTKLQTHTETETIHTMDILRSCEYHFWKSVMFFSLLCSHRVISLNLQLCLLGASRPEFTWYRFNSIGNQEIHIDHIYLFICVYVYVCE